MNTYLHAVVAIAVACLLAAGGAPPTTGLLPSLSPSPSPDPPPMRDCGIEQSGGDRVPFVSLRSAGDLDIWIADRHGSGTLALPTLLGAPINGPADDYCPVLLPDGSLLFFSTRGGVDAYGTFACGPDDPYVAVWLGEHHGWAPPRNLGCPARTSARW
ncbi:PD40 domain-containing protein [Microbacterium sp. 2FI]|uniref:PD40 domain-containing protein n=1 Tax=Microbacterium sp. 2FI TaxID=2502193 RepID=UPI0014851F4F|nr:PD40 domain-containing protein [Microbacterium sp. 2FI]